MHAYWSEQADIGDEEMLIHLVVEAGLDDHEVRATLADRRYAERVDASTRQANMHGINAIPAFVLDRRLLVLGAHPYETFEQGFERLGSGETR
jgi:predicted DsbA family dithiol-disulfide isomerase